MPGAPHLLRDRRDATVLTLVLGMPHTEARLTDDLVTLNHPFGIVRLERAGVPKELAAMLAMEQSTPVHKGIAQLLREVDAHKAAVVPHQKEGMSR